MQQNPAGGVVSNEPRFRKVPEWVLELLCDRAALTHLEWRVYGAILRRASFNGDRTAFFTVRSLAAAAGTDPAQTTRSLRKLAEPREDRPPLIDYTPGDKGTSSRVRVIESVDPTTTQPHGSVDPNTTQSTTHAHESARKAQHNEASTCGVESTERDLVTEPRATDANPAHDEDEPLGEQYHALCHGRGCPECGDSGNDPEWVRRVEQQFKRKKARR